MKKVLLLIFCIACSISGYAQEEPAPEAEPLPVTWLSFTGQVQPAGVHLRWATATESNTELFTVERSLNGRDFYKIGVVRAAGNSHLVQRYTFQDWRTPSLAGKTLYYRLNQQDLDNTQTYSKIIAVNCQQNAATVVYPNPFHESITIYLPGIPAYATDKVTLNKLDGGEVYAKSLAHQGTTAIVLEDLPDITPGLYLLKVVVNNQLSVHKLTRK
jgi:hypothetical protein